MCITARLCGPPSGAKAAFTSARGNSYALLKILTTSNIAVRPGRRVLCDEVVSTPNTASVYVAPDEDSFHGVPPFPVSVLFRCSSSKAIADNINNEVEQINGEVLTACEHQSGACSLMAT